MPDDFADPTPTTPSQQEAQAILQQLATGVALVPQEVPDGAEPPPDGTIGLPVVEEDGTQFVPVFTSTEALAAAGADPAHAAQIPFVHLAAGWPSEDLWMAIDPSTPDGLALPPDVVRALPGLVGAGPDGVS